MQQKQFYDNKTYFDESANLIDSYDIAFDASDWWNLP